MSTFTGWIPVIVVLVALAAVYVPFGNYMAATFTSEKHTNLEKACYRLIGVNPQGKQKWPHYTASVLGFSAISVVCLYLLQRLQQWMPLNHGEQPVDWDQAWNTAVSFTTNANWQSYSGEGAMSLFTQMAGLAVQNFLSAAVGITVAIALIRGLANRLGNGDIGNFWVDLTRTVFRILLPMAAIGATLLIS